MKTFRKRAYAKTKGLKLTSLGNFYDSVSKTHRTYWIVEGDGSRRFFKSYVRPGRTNKNAYQIRNDIDKYKWPSDEF